ncbi:hypothetical protein WA026_007305 [Henosepilachna vigintioctopunctata]|uniref:AFP-like domain-containing protein n=1 Tax=Henosepilachna vigintioctopunctata TaxID=420089 RepID=A0AAW1UWW1_9CUCU
MDASTSGTSEIAGGSLLLGDRLILSDSPVFFIAEVGQNHQGDIKIAEQLIDAAKNAGADCVKFQKTNLKEKFTKKALSRPYENRNSWGKTYGEHKQYLEFSDVEFKQLQEYAKNKNIMFTASAMDIKSLQFLLDINVPFVKIGSGDANNIPLLLQAAKSEVPLVISTGMQALTSVEKIHSIVKRYNAKNFALLHCVSSYPTPLEDINLSIIKLYQQTFPNNIIGYSGHELGIDVSVAATVMGAKIIERHITLDKSQKGTDHSCSLLPEEFFLMVQNVKKLQIAIGIPQKVCMQSELICWFKLGKTLVAAKNLTEGQIIKADDLKIKIADPKGIDPIYYESILGKTLKTKVKQDQAILHTYIDFEA